MHRLTLLALFFPFWLSACLDDDHKDSEPEPEPEPTTFFIELKHPLADEVGISPDIVVSASFSMPANAGTINADTFTLAGGDGVDIPATIEYRIFEVATLTPLHSLANGLDYTVKVSGDVKSEGGLAITGDLSWTFTTSELARNMMDPVVEHTIPGVSATTPVDGATGVSIDAGTSVSFSEAMDRATVGNSFTLSQGLTPVSGNVTLDDTGLLATFTPSAPLGRGLVYTGTVSTSAMSAAGIALSAESVWSFTTELPGAAPTVTFTPLASAPYISVNDKVRATFSADMDPATVTDPATFTLAQGVTAVAGDVTFDTATRVATFTPRAALAPGVAYTARVSSAATGLTGSAVAPGSESTFTTAACSLTPVALGAAATFAVLATDTVSNTGASSIVGSIGVSPGTEITGFPLGTPTVGTLESATAAADLAREALTLAYGDAAGRVLCPLDVTGQDLGGQTLTPGLYNATTQMSNSGTLTLNAQGDADAVFIFQAGRALATSSAFEVVLTNGARAANVFWQVDGPTIISATSSIVGTILANTSITIGNGASLQGRALAREGNVTLDDNDVSLPTP
jgi:ice-binding like protein/Big-like domain-containing protein